MTASLPIQASSVSCDVRYYYDKEYFANNMVVNIIITDAEKTHIILIFYALMLAFHHIFHCKGVAKFLLIQYFGLREYKKA